MTAPDSAEPPCQKCGGSISEATRVNYRRMWRMCGKPDGEYKFCSLCLLRVMERALKEDLDE